MNAKKIFLITWLTMSLAWCDQYGLYAQYGAVKYRYKLDTARNRIMPFDIPFTVQIKNDEKDPVKYIYLFRVNLLGDLIPDDQTSARKDKSIERLTRITYKKDSIDVDLPPLKPDKHYMVVTVTEKAKVERLKKLAAEYCIQKSLEGFEIEVGPPGYFSDKRPAKESVTKEYLNTAFQKSDTDCKLCSFVTYKPNSLTDKVTTKGSFGKPPFGISNCDTCLLQMNSKIFASAEVQLREDLRFVDGVFVNLLGHSEEVLTGAIALDTLRNRENVITNVSTLASKDAERLANLAKTSGIIMTAKQTLYMLVNQIGGTNADYLSDMDAYLTVIGSNMKSLRLNIDNNDNLNNCLQKMDVPVGWQLSVLSGTTASYQFLTRAGYFIKPDFGLFYYGSRGANAFQGVAPFIGFHINFRSTNTDVPFNDIKSAWKYPTIQVGIPIFADNLSVDGSREHLVGNKFSLFTGVGFNFSHSARITAGALMFRKFTGNAVAGNYAVDAVPYVAVSFDIRLKKYMKGLNEVVKSLWGKDL